jgi:hypothetical protein
MGAEARVALGAARGTNTADVAFATEGRGGAPASQVRVSSLRALTRINVATGFECRDSAFDVSRGFPPASPQMSTVACLRSSATITLGGCTAALESSATHIGDGALSAMRSPYVSSRAPTMRASFGSPMNLLRRPLRTIGQCCLHESVR